jgi:putative ABC transport system ATP-binding protein
MDRRLFGFIFRYSTRDQLLIVPLVLATMVVYYFSLDLPKVIINEAIQGRSFSSPGATVPFMRIAFSLPQFLGGASVNLFDGFALERVPYLMALSVVFLGLIILNGGLKFQINTMKGWMGERMLRRLRFALFDMILRFPLARFRRVKSAELSTMIKDEVEPLGGFIGESLITPLFLGGQALTGVVFILYQHVALGMIAVSMVAVQAILIPRLRRRLLVLAKQRQLGARQLAGRIAECADGALEIHAHDTSNFERAELSSRLGALFLIRFEFYQRKFFIKFINNFLSQLTPFLFFTVGGYLVIAGKLDLGALVAVIAAYKDLPTPIKELIDWDQQRLDAAIKYSQVIEQFSVDDALPEQTQALIPAPELPRNGNVRVSNLSLIDDTGSAIVEGASFEAGLNEHIAVVGDQAVASTALLQLIARLMPPTSGAIEMGGIDIVRAPEAVTGRAIGYAGASSYLFPVSVRENLLYGLKHWPVSEPEYSGTSLTDREFQLREAARTGSSKLDISANWIDYAAADASGPEEIEARIQEVLTIVELEESIFELGLRNSVDLEQDRGLDAILVGARKAMLECLNEPGIQELVERFDPQRYIQNATLAENLLFGTPVGKTFDIENLATNAYMREVLAETGLAADMLAMGHKVAATMVELFSGLPPGHESFERFSFIRSDDLPFYKAILSKVSNAGLEGLSDRERSSLLTLPFKLIPTKHRLGLIDGAFEARILRARGYFAEHLPESMRGEVAFFDPEAYNRALSLQDNILFGKIATGQAGAVSRLAILLRQVLDTQGLRSLVVRIGLSFQVGVGGTRLPMADRQKIALARVLLKRPAVLVLDQALTALDLAAQKRVMQNVLDHCKDRCVIWALQRLELAELFAQTLVLQRGCVVERGKFTELKTGNGALHALLSAQ